MTESEASLPDYASAAKALGEKNIAMVTLLPDDSPKTLTDTRKMLEPFGPKPPGAWLIDSKENPLARELRVQSLPLFVLISNEGRVLFNGDPTDDGLWDALTKIDPKIERPESHGIGE